MKTIMKPLEGLTENLTEHDIPKEVVSAVPMSVTQMIDVLSFANPNAKVVLPIETSLLSVVKLSLDDQNVYIGLGADINKSTTPKEIFLQAIQDLIYDKSIPVTEKILRVWIENPDMHGREMILNPAENLQAKHNYYKSAYDDELHLISNPDVFITSYVTGNNGLVEVVE